MALEQHNTALDFETMLRRHLSRGGSVVEACMGFNVDTANAYLENALGASARSQYDSHLAGCPSCRRHVIELSRLMQLPQPETNRAPVVAPPSIWSHWKSVVADWGEWLGITTWQQGWATAGIAAAILIGVVSVQLWRQQTAKPSETNVAITEPVNGNSTSQLDLNSAASNFGAQGETTVTSAQSLTANNIPKPDVSPNPNGLSLVAGSNSAVGTAFAQPNGGQSLTLVATTPPSFPEAKPTTGILVSSLAGGQTFNVPIARTAADESAAPVAPPVAEAEPRENVVTAQIGPLPSDNPMVKKGKEPKPPKISSSVMDKAFSFLPTRKSEDARKLEEKEIEKDAPSLLSVRRRDKVFNHQGGFWVDSAYKPDMAWRVTKVVLDSEEYKHLLAAEPMLKEYFAHGQAIVVWKDKIYKVVAK
ncbi:MAG: zf-HC2 domain-containing protein [Acidobacteriota bacterium]|nr:zf-HC2 domain-containing protein [Acidobacteriota bacterium]